MLTQERLKELLDYEPETGNFFWRIRRGRGAPAGGIAGTPHKNGYTSIKIDGGGPYLAHRLAWLYVTGEWPDELDHINRNKKDNRFTNLRECTRQQNQANRDIQKNNKSGWKGVRKLKDNKWLARIQVGGKTVFIGHFKSASDASQAYADASRRLHGDFSTEANS